MKKALSLLLVTVCVVIACFTIGGIKEAEAASNIAGGICGDNIDWWLTTDGDMYFEGTGTMYNWDWYDDVPWYTNMDQIKTVTVKSGVTSVGENAFHGADNLKKVTLSSTVTSIQSDAFRDCGKLASINLPTKLNSIGWHSFANCSSLKSVKLPSGIKTLGMCCFEGSGLTSITIPASITSMGGYDFRDCDSLTSATIGVGEGAFELESFAFLDCDNLTTVKMGSAVTNIVHESFGDCPKLVNVTIGPKVTHIRSAFKGCTGLKEIVIPDSVTTLEWGSSGFYGAFTNCTSLEKIVFGKGISYIAEETFEGCTAIKEIYFKGNAPTFESTETFKGCTIKGYVPKNNTTWRPATLTNHGGYIDWNKVDPFAMNTPKISGGNKAETGKPTLSWSKMTGASKYEIWRATSKTGTYSKLYTQYSTSYTNTTATAGKSYYYKIRAINGDGVKSQFSNALCLTCDCARPVTKIYTKSASGKPALEWAKVPGATKYEVYRSTSSNGTYSKMIATTSTSYENSIAIPGKTYYYKVKAICGTNSYANSALSTAKSITCDCARPVITLTRNTKGQPKLTWKKVEGASKYVVYRATSKTGTYTKMYTTTGLNYTNTTAKAGKTYYYKVKAICGKSEYGNSAYSTVKYITAK